MAIDPALQQTIRDVQAAHSSLVDAARNGASEPVSQTANTELASYQTRKGKILDTESLLLDLVNPEHKKPSMLLDFRNKVFMKGVRGLERGYADREILSITRDGAKWLMGPAGRNEEIPAQSLGYEYDLATGESLGFRREPSATNVVPNGETILGSSGWSTIGVDMAIDSSVRGMRFLLTKITEDTSTGYHNATRRIGPLDNSAYSISFTCKPSENRQVQFYLTQFGSGSLGGTFNVRADGTIDGPGVNAAQRAYARKLPSGAIRVQVMTYPPGEAGLEPVLYFRVSNNTPGDGSSYIHVGEVSVTKGMPSSHIPTTGASVTRPHDLVHAVINDCISQQSGTIVLTAMMHVIPDSNRGVFQIGSVDGVGHYRVFVEPNGRLVAKYGSANQLGVYGDTTIPNRVEGGEIFTLAMTYDIAAGKANWALNGTAGEPSNLPTNFQPIVPHFLSFGTLGIGGGFPNNINFLEVKLYQESMTVAELEEAANGN